MGLLGDIHGNHLALQAVLNAAHTQRVERLLITGDLIGYYFWPKEVLELLAPWNIEVVRGNHEEMLARARRNPSFLREVERRYGSGLRVAIETLFLPQLDWLETLPHPRKIDIDECGILLCHGSPLDLNQYVYPDAACADTDRFFEMDCDWIVFGHTHHPMERQCGTVTIVNPGSVGQPRNRQPGAHWMVLDTNHRTIHKRIESYDIDWVIEQSRGRHPNLTYLGDVLGRI